MFSSADGRALGIVPARQGSKGIPSKNLQDLGGKPLLQHTLDAALGAARISDTIVTSDDPEVLALALRAGARALERPAELATDSASMGSVVGHALDWTELHSGTVGVFVLLQPTSPFRTATDIDAALAAYDTCGCETLVSVCPVTQHPSDCVLLDDAQRTRMVEVPRMVQGHGRQAYSPCYFIDGGIYISSTAYFRRTGNFRDDASAVHVIPRSHGIDIDHPFDLAVARALIAQSQLAPDIFTL